MKPWDSNPPVDKYLHCCYWILEVPPLITTMVMTLVMMMVMMMVPSNETTYQTAGVVYSVDISMKLSCLLVSTMPWNAFIRVHTRCMSVGQSGTMVLTDSCRTASIKSNQHPSLH